MARDWRDHMPRTKTSLTYSRFHGFAESDHGAEQTARALKEISLSVSTENVIHAFRLLILQGFFTPDEVNVFFEKEAGEFLLVTFDKEGRTNDWHSGFCDTNDKVLHGLLGWEFSGNQTPNEEGK